MNLSKLTIIIYVLIILISSEKTPKSNGQIDEIENNLPDNNMSKYCNTIVIDKNAKKIPLENHLQNVVPFHVYSIRNLLSFEERKTLYYNLINMLEKCYKYYQLSNINMEYLQMSYHEVNLKEVIVLSLSDKMLQYVEQQQDQSKIQSYKNFVYFKVLLFFLEVEFNLNSGFKNKYENQMKNLFIERQTEYSLFEDLKYDMELMLALYKYQFPYQNEDIQNLIISYVKSYYSLKQTDKILKEIFKYLLILIEKKEYKKSLVSQGYMDEKNSLDVLIPQITYVPSLLSKKKKIQIHKQITKPLVKYIEKKIEDIPFDEIDISELNSLLIN